MTIYDKALELVPDGAALGLGSGRAASAFVKQLAERVRAGLRLRAVATSQATAKLATELGIPVVSLEEAMPLDLVVDGADEVDPQLNLIKGYGRALVREKIVAASSKRLIILAGLEKQVQVLGSRGKLPVEVVPFGLALCQRRLSELGLRPVPYESEGRLFVTDNGNHILDCGTGPILQPAELEAQIRAIPGVVGTGLFLGMSDTVLIGDNHFELVREMHRKGG